MSPPRDLFLEANRLRLHLLDWSEPGSAGPPVLLLHGLQEHAHAWDLVAPHLAAAGHRVLALDWRGHGESEWIGRGGYYHFADYAADLAFLVRALGGRVVLIGHSMGGNAALIYSGTEPERVGGLVSVEGLGPPDFPPEMAPDRFSDWIEDLERAPTRRRRRLSLDQATARLATSFPLWPREAARLMARHGTREDDGALVWRFDPLHQTRSPQPYFVSQARAFWQRIRCPVLYVEGEQSRAQAAALGIEERIEEIGAHRATIAGAGHHPHLEKPDDLAPVLAEFLAALPGSGAAHRRAGRG